MPKVKRPPRDLYDSQQGTLAQRIDKGWGRYTDENSSPTVKRKALRFLIYAFDIKAENKSPYDLNQELALLMKDREQYKEANPGYIPGKSPKHLKFSPELQLINQINPTKVKHREAIDQNKLLEMEDSIKLGDKIFGANYFNAEQRAEYRVVISQGKFRKNGSRFDTKEYLSHEKKGFAAYTLNANGEFSLFNHNVSKDRKLHHASMNAGIPVVAAGELKITRGNLEIITTYSGHYKPSLFTVYQLLEHLKERGVDISNVKVHTMKQLNKSLNVTTKWHNVYNHDGVMTPYETPATEIMGEMTKYFEKCVDNIQQEIKAYNNSKTSAFYSFIDSITGKSITRDRENVATNLQEKLSSLKNNLTTIGSREELVEKITELDGIIKNAYAANEQVSRGKKPPGEEEKSPNSGRLAQKMLRHKAELAELKARHENTEEESLHDTSALKGLS